MHVVETIGYAFRDAALLEEALTTPAYRMDEPDARDNQRLEFLGDAILGLLSAERVFAEFPDEPEGALTVRRAHMVSSAALCAAAARLGLAGMLRASPCAWQSTAWGRPRPPQAPAGRRRLSPLRGCWRPSLPNNGIIRRQ